MATSYYSRNMKESNSTLFSTMFPQTSSEGQGEELDMKAAAAAAASPPLAASTLPHGALSSTSPQTKTTTERPLTADDTEMPTSPSASNDNSFHIDPRLVTPCKGSEATCSSPMQQQQQQQPSVSQEQLQDGPSAGLKAILPKVDWSLVDLPSNTGTTSNTKPAMPSKACSTALLPSLASAGNPIGRPTTMNDYPTNVLPLNDTKTYYKATKTNSSDIFPEDESLVNEYLDQKYREYVLGQQQFNTHQSNGIHSASATSSMLPSLAFLTAMNPTVQDLLEETEFKVDNENSKELCTDDYAPIDLTRTNSTEIHKALLDLDPTCSVVEEVINHEQVLPRTVDVYEDIADTDTDADASSLNIPPLPTPTQLHWTTSADAFRIVLAGGSNSISGGTQHRFGASDSISDVPTDIPCLNRVKSEDLINAFHSYMEASSSSFSKFDDFVKEGIKTNNVCVSPDPIQGCSIKKSGCLIEEGDDDNYDEDNDDFDESTSLAPQDLIHLPSQFSNQTNVPYSSPIVAPSSINLRSQSSLDKFQLFELMQDSNCEFQDTAAGMNMEDSFEIFSSSLSQIQGPGSAFDTSDQEISFYEDKGNGVGHLARRTAKRRVSFINEDIQEEQPKKAKGSTKRKAKNSPKSLQKKAKKFHATNSPEAEKSLHQEDNDHNGSKKVAKKKKTKGPKKKSDKKARKPKQSDYTEEQNDLWQSNFKRLLDFQKIHGHVRVGTTYKDQRLATWIKRQRLLYRQFLSGETSRALSKRRIDCLNSLGFIWDIEDYTWKQGFHRFEESMRDTGNCFELLLTPWKGSGGKHHRTKLWILNQQHHYELYLQGDEKARTNEDRISRLIEAGFDFKYAAICLASKHKKLDLKKKRAEAKSASST